MSSPDSAPAAAVFGCAGLGLSEDERRFFGDARPLGLILFERNCRDPAQLGALVEAFREAVGRARAPVLVDQEGGRVARLKPPHWRAAPPAARFGELARHDRGAAVEAVRLNAQLIGAELAALGVSINCAPVADVPVADGHDVIGDRAFSAAPETVTALARAACEGLLEAGVLPVIKHLPGHGRARADSHRELPRVDASLEVLRRADFAPFRALADMPWAMTAHVLYSAVDARAPATVSPKVIAEVIRGEIGFEGVLVSDDLSMEALSGSLGARAGTALAAGCDVVLHCSGALAEMIEVAEAIGPVSAEGSRRLERAAAMARRPGRGDAAELLARLDELLSPPGRARP